MATKGMRCDDRTDFFFSLPKFKLLFPSRNELLILKSTRLTFK